MDSNTLTGLAIAVGVGAGLVIASARRKKANASLAETIEPALREHGALTLPALAEKIGMSDFVARGKVAMALNEMAAGGKLEILEAPEGTPQLEKVNHIQYRLR